MLVNKLKELAEGKGYFFNYGDYDWQNLLDMNDDTEKAVQDKAFLLLWKDRDKGFNGFNVLVRETFSGEFVLTARSGFGEKDYNHKYETRISKMENELDSFTQLITDCDNLFIEQWKETEVSNVLDTNLDGVKVNFRIRHDV